MHGFHDCLLKYLAVNGKVKFNEILEKISINIFWKRASKCVSKNYLKRDFEVLYDSEIYFLIFTRKVIIFFVGSPL